MGPAGRAPGMGATRLTTPRWGLDRAEIVTTVAAVAASTGLYLTYRHPYLARGVVGDSLALAILTVPLVLRARRARHEALVCLAGIGLVYLLGWDWPLRLPAWLWWAVIAADLVGYLAVRRVILARDDVARVPRSR